MNPSFLAPVVGNSVPDLGATGQISSATNIFLTPASLGYQNIVMTAAGQSVFLPPTYATVPGQREYTFRNSGTYSYGVRDSNGVLQAVVGGGGFAVLSLDNNTTWGITGSNLEAGLTTIDTTLGTTFSNTVYAPYVVMDSNTSIHFATFPGLAGFVAYVVDNLGKVVSTPVTVTVTSQAAPRAAFRITPTTAIIFYAAPSGSTHSAVVITLTGSSPNFSVSIGTPASITTGATMNAWGGENSVGIPRITALTTNLYLASFNVSLNASVVAASVSGTTVTFGAIFSAAASGAGIDQTLIYPASSTTGLLIYPNTGTAAILAVVITVTGVTCTAGTAQTSPSLNANGSGLICSACQLSPTKYLLFTNNVSTVANVNAVTVTGTTVAIGATLTIESGVTGFNTSTATDAFGPGYIQSGATRYNPHLSPITTATALVWYMDNAGISRCSVLTESGGTVTTGSLLYSSISGGVVGATDSGQILPQGTTEFVSLKEDGNSTGLTYKHRLVAQKISGTTVTAGQSTLIPNLNSQVAMQSHVFLRTTNGDYILGLSQSSTVSPAESISVYRSNGDYLAFRGFINVPGLTSYTAATAQASANRLVLIGSPIFSGTTQTPATNSQLRILNVELVP